MECVNKIVAGQTILEYKEMLKQQEIDNKELIKKIYEDNKEQIKELINKQIEDHIKEHMIQFRL